MTFDPFSAAMDLIGKGIDKIFPDKNEANRVKLEMLKLDKQGEFETLKTEADLQIKQMVINSDEAKHASWWVAGWRPYIGWICGSVLAAYYLPRAILVNALWVIACAKNNWVLVPFPPMDISELLQILLGMLGLGLLRTVERVKQQNGNGSK